MRRRKQIENQFGDEFRHVMNYSIRPQSSGKLYDDLWASLGGRLWNQQCSKLILTLRRYLKALNA